MLNQLGLSIAHTLTVSVLPEVITWTVTTLQYQTQTIMVDPCQLERNIPTGDMSAELEELMYLPSHGSTSV